MTTNQDSMAIRTLQHKVAALEIENEKLRKVIEGLNEELAEETWQRRCGPNKEPEFDV